MPSEYLKTCVENITWQHTRSVPPQQGPQRAASFPSSLSPVFSFLDFHRLDPPPYFKKPRSTKLLTKASTNASKNTMKRKERLRKHQVVFKSPWPGKRDLALKPQARNEREMQGEHPSHARHRSLYPTVSSFIRWSTFLTHWFSFPRPLDTDTHLVVSAKGLVQMTDGAPSMEPDGATSSGPESPFAGLLPSCSLVRRSLFMASDGAHGIQVNQLLTSYIFMIVIQASFVYRGGPNSPSLMPAHHFWSCVDAIMHVALRPLLYKLN